MSENAELIPAATVLLLRQSNNGLEVLMVRRNSKIAFGGMWVFPGGRVDADDHVRLTDTVTAGRGSPSMESPGFSGSNQAVARVAAAREVAEESGLEIDASQLVPWSFWVPPMKPVVGKGPARRFETWFFAAEAPTGDVVIDQGEILDHAWLSPTDAMEKRQAGEIELAPPTWVSLWQLGKHDSVQAALQWATDTPTHEFRTKPIAKDPLTLAWPGDGAYDQTDGADSGQRNRLCMHADGWVYEFSEPD